MKIIKQLDVLIDIKSIKQLDENYQVA